MGNQFTINILSSRLKWEHNAVNQREKKNYLPPKEIPL